MIAISCLIDLGVNVACCLAAERESPPQLGFTLCTPDFIDAHGAEGSSMHDYDWLGHEKSNGRYAVSLIGSVEHRAA